MNLVNAIYTFLSVDDDTPERHTPERHTRLICTGLQRCSRASERQVDRRGGIRRLRRRPRGAHLFLEDGRGLLPVHCRVRTGRQEAGGPGQGGGKVQVGHGQLREEPRPDTPDPPRARPQLFRLLLRDPEQDPGGVQGND